MKGHIRGGVRKGKREGGDMIRKEIGGRKEEKDNRIQMQQ